ncbi:hypothetical protein BC332_13634 [Capsicum chinense]|nr:hypothetical protein BC332_13634 [Capsicum chinense]
MLPPDVVKQVGKPKSKRDREPNEVQEKLVLLEITLVFQCQLIYRILQSRQPESETKQSLLDNCKWKPKKEPKWGLKANEYLQLMLSISSTLAYYNEDIAATITTLSSSDLMAYIDCGGPPEDLIGWVKMRLHEKNLA